MKRKTPFLTPFLLVFLLFNAFVFAQKPDELKELEAKLATAKIDTAKVNLMYKIAKAYRGINPIFFDSNLKRGLALATKIKYVKGQSDYYKILAYKFLSEGNPKAGLAYAHKGSALSLSCHDTIGYLKNMYFEAASYMYLGEREQAKTHLDKAITFLKNKPFYSSRGELYTLFVQYYSQFDLAKSFEYLVLEYDCLKKENNPNQMLSVYNEFAGYYLSVSDIKESIVFSKRALAEANKIRSNSELNRATAMTNLASVLIDDAQYEKAKVYVRKSLEISQKIQNPKLIFSNNLQLAIIFIHEARYREALDISEQLVENAFLPDFYFRANLIKASANNGLKQYKAALKSLTEVDQSMLKILTQSVIIDYYDQLSISYFGLGDYKSAYLNIKKKNEIESKFLDDKGSMRTLGLQIKFELSQKNYAIQKLQLEKKIAKEKQLKQSATLNLLIGGSVLLVILIAVLVWAYQFRKRGNFIFGLSRIQLQNAIQEKEVLVKEIHHRVKNNFQLISSMMNIQAMDKSIDVEEFVKRTTSRIVSLSSIHEKLYMKDNLYQLDANDYVKEMANYVQSSFMDSTTNIDFQFSDDVVILDLETIMPLGLIINELLTNSYKYAFNDRSQGMIEIKIKQLSSNKYQLTYADNGVGLHDGKSFSKSIGMNLIEALSKQLGAEPKMNFENGAHFEIIFKKND